MANGLFIIIFAIIAAIILIGMLFSNKAIVKRKLKHTPSKTIQEFKDGDIAKLTGKAKNIKSPLKAPLSGRECVYYYVLVERRTSTGKSTHWKTIIEEELCEDFFIEEGQDRAIVNTENIKSYLIIDENFSSGFLKDATPELEKYLHKHGYESTNLLGFNKTLRYKEGVIEIGEEVAVVGTGRWLKTDEDKILEIGESEQLPVFLSDHPNTLAFVKPKGNKKVKMRISNKHSNQKRDNKKIPRYNKSYKR